MAACRYKAFISYSHRDKDWSAWLQRALERYRIPRRLVGTQGEFGPVPRRLTPVFRDREDLSSSANLSATVKESLENSETMIVICSPASSQSIWVNSEVQYFRSLGRENRIYALIVDGDPQAADPGEQCFPLALISDPDGASREPLAADARKWADGKLLAKLKIISGILGLRLDDLRRRDMQRRQRLWMISVGGTAAVAVVMAILAVMAITARTAAENRREHAEDLVGYMVGDLRSKLDEVGRLDILEGMGGRVSEYLETLDPDEVTDESLIQQAQVWRQLGEVSKEQGDLTEALRAFTTSRDVLAELYRRNPENAEYLFELGNAEFWIGYVHFDAGEFDNAEQAFELYLDNANKLVGMEPGNPRWLMEQSYAHSNTAALIIERGGPDAEGALSHIMAAVELNRKVIDMDPGNATYQSEMGEALAWLADTQLQLCNLGEALISRQESAAIAERLSSESPGNANLKSRYAFAVTGVANVAQQIGLADLARENFLRSKEILAQMVVIEPRIVDHRFAYLMRETYDAVIASEKGDLDAAIARMEMIREPLEQVLQGEDYANLKRRTDWVYYLLASSDMDWRAGNTEAASALISEAIQHLRQLLSEGNDPASFTDKLWYARFLFWQQRGEDLFGTDGFEGLEVSFDTHSRSCWDRAGLVGQAILTGDIDTARGLVHGLLAKGFYDPGFIRTCRQYDLCQ